VHHIFPKNYLKKKLGLAKGRYNQLANFVLAQSEINIAIGDHPPEIYFRQIEEQCKGSTKKYGGISDCNMLQANLRSNCIPIDAANLPILDYDQFLDARRKLMSAKLKDYYFSL